MSLPFMGPDEVLYGAVIGALGFRLEKTAGQFPAAAVVVHAVAADAFARAGLIGAGAFPGVGVFFTFHGFAPRLDTILSKMAGARIELVPIIDAVGQIVGVVRDIDLLRALK